MNFENNEFEKNKNIEILKITIVLIMQCARYPCKVGSINIINHYLTRQPNKNPSLTFFEFSLFFIFSFHIFCIHNKQPTDHDN